MLSELNGISLRVKWERERDESWKTGWKRATDGEGWVTKIFIGGNGANGNEGINRTDTVVNDGVIDLNSHLHRKPDVELSSLEFNSDNTACLISHFRNISTLKLVWREKLTEHLFITWDFRFHNNLYHHIDTLHWCYSDSYIWDTATDIISALVATIEMSDLKWLFLFHQLLISKGFSMFAGGGCHAFDRNVEMVKSVCHCKWTLS